MRGLTPAVLYKLLGEPRGKRFPGHILHNLRLLRKRWLSIFMRKTARFYGSINTVSVAVLQSLLLRKKKKKPFLS